jgi:hypothetical protein
LIVTVTLDKEQLEMMKLTLACISKLILRIHPKFEEVIISFISAQNKGNDAYSLNKEKLAYHDTLDSSRLGSVS